MLKPNGRFYELTEDYTFRDIVVPKGFLTDGISYKFRLLALFVNKFDPRFIEAIIVHDYLCELEQYKKADEYLEIMLPTNWRKKIMINGAKIYHKLRYGV